MNESPSIIVSHIVSLPFHLFPPVSCISAIHPLIDSSCIQPSSHLPSISIFHLFHLLSISPPKLPFSSICLFDFPSTTLLQNLSSTCLFLNLSVPPMPFPISSVFLHLHSSALPSLYPPTRLPFLLRFTFPISSPSLFRLLSFLAFF